MIGILSLIRLSRYTGHNRILRIFFIWSPDISGASHCNTVIAIELLQKKQEAEAQKHIKKFEEEPELEILNGRYGPYIAYKGSNYKTPKDIIPQDLNLQACLEIVKLQSDKDTGKSKRTAKAVKATKTTKTTAKATAKTSKTK